MKRLPVYVMTAAIAMTGAASITSQAAVKVVAVGAGGAQCDLSWKELAGNCLNGIKLPDCDIFNPGGSGLPGMNQPASPNPGGNGLPDIGVPSQPDVNVPNQPGQGESNSSFTAQVVSLVNEERAKAGLSPLIVDSRAAAAASTRAKELKTSFSHTRPDGSSFSTALTQSGASFTGAGENIAYGQRTPQEVMDGWMNSQGHRANILNKDFTTIGVGYYENGGVGYWTQLFMR